MAEEIFVGSVAVGVVPDARGWNRKLAADLIPSSDQVGKEYGQRLSKNIVDEMGRHRPAMAKEGERSGGAFADTFRKRIDAAIKSLPKVRIDGDSSAADRKLEAVRVKLEALSKKKIGIDIDASAAFKEMAALDLELEAVAKKAGSIDVKFNTLEARAQLALLKHQAGEAGDTSGRNLMQKLAGGITGAATSLGGGGSVGSAAPAGLAGAVGPAGLAVAGALGLFALPFIGQVVGGAVVSAFGLSLAAMPIIGAARNAEVTKTFTDMKDRVLQDFEVIGQSWVPVLESILNTAKQTMDHLTPVFEHAANIIAGPFRLFADTLITSFTQPQVVSSINAVATAFGDILKAIAPDLPGMVATLADAVKRIAEAISKNPKAFANFVNFLIQVVAFTLNAIAVLTRLANFMEGRFKQNINSMVATWKAASAGVAAAWNRTVSGIHRAWGDFINFWVLTGHQLEAAWNRTCSGVHRAWSDTTNFLHRAWSDFINFFVRGGHQIEATWNSVCNHIHQAWSATVNFLHRVWSAFVNFWVQAGHQIESIWNSVTGSIHKAWSNTVNFITGLWHSGMTFIQNAVNGMWNVVHTVFGNILKAASWAFGWIPGIGPKLREASARFNNFRDSANGSLAGIKDRTVNVGVKMGPAQQSIASPAFRAQYGKATGGPITWGSGPRADDVPILASRGEFMQPADSVSHYGIDFMEAVRTKRFAAGGLIPGIHLPSGSQIRKSLLSQLTSFVSSAWHSIGGFFSHLVGGGGGGVGQWSGVVSQALSLLGMSQALMGRILYQMRTESGGNPNAINNWDINAQRGDPSRGLMQVIGSTFAAYHVPGTSNNIYDPLANVAAAINYARHVYGPSLGALGSGHGYADGGPIVEPIVGFGLGTGLMYRFGEKGREWVSPGGSAPRGGDGSATYHAHFDGLTGAAIESHVRSAFQAMAITSGSLQRQGRRS